MEPRHMEEEIKEEDSLEVFSSCQRESAGQYYYEITLKSEEPLFR
jgi:hypothetical protein